MARIRTIKPSIWGDQRFASLSRDARLLTIGLISNADDAGRFIAGSVAIAGTVFPHDEIPPAKIRRWRDEVARAGLVRLYTVDGREYGCFPRWLRHQRIDRPQPSVLPPPPAGPPDSPNDSPNGSANHSANESPNQSQNGSTNDSTTNSTTEVEGIGRSVRALNPLPVTKRNARAGEREGDELPGQTADDPLTRLVADVRAIRPKWTAQAITAAARRCTDAGRSPADTRVALLAVANDASSTAPGRVLVASSWWPGPPTRTPPPVSAVLADMPPADPDVAARGREAVRAVLSRRQPEPEAVAQ